ncbi:MAG: spermidine synthase [Magnetococcales bacterium]|nr:spermidine synthase [Magnetococcales bacterium]
MRYPLKVIHRSRSDHNTVIEVCDQGPMRWLHFGSYLKQSAMKRDDPNHLVLPYTRHMMASLLFNPHPSNGLMIGLGGGSMVKFLLHHFPECRLHVVEHSQTVISMAHGYFEVPRSPRLGIYADDGLDFLLRNQPPSPACDLIIIDAFDSDGMAQSVYAHKFLNYCSQWLSDSGVLAINLTRTNMRLYSTMLDALKSRFNGFIVTLPCGLSKNVIAFAFRHTPPFRQGQIMFERAASLKQHLKLDFPFFLKKMYKHNLTVRERMLIRMGL